MPILLSSNDKDPSGRTLATTSANTIFTVEIKTNGIWILNPSINDAQAIDYIANPASNPPVKEPAVTIGQTINSDNGIKSAGSQFPLVSGMTVFFPVTADSVGTGTPSHQVIGFVGMKISSFSAKNPNPSLTGVLVPAVGPGVNTGGAQNPVFSSYPFAKQGATVDIAHLIQ